MASFCAVEVAVPAAPMRANHTNTFLFVGKSTHVNTFKQFPDLCDIQLKLGSEAYAAWVPPQVSTG